MKIFLAGGNGREKLIPYVHRGGNINGHIPGGGNIRKPEAGMEDDDGEYP